MRFIRLAGLLLGFVAAFASYGCVFDPAGLQGNTASAGGSASVGTSVSTTATGEMVTSTASGPCTSAAEICDDGVDNDCNGKIDCEDEACTGTLGYACSPAAPDGWMVVAFKNDPAPQCPTGYQNPTNVTTAPTGNSTCSCNCGAAPADICTKGKLDVQFGYQNCGGKAFNLTTTGGCDPIGSVIGIGPQGVSFKDATATGPGLSNTACSATPSGPTVFQVTESVSCAPSSTGGKGCGSNSACLPKVDAAGWCIQKAGDLACPDAAFTHKQVVYAKDDITDNRSCGACACKATATKCNNGKFTSFVNAQCSGTGVSLNVGVGCQSFNGDNQAHAYFKYTANPDTTACSVSSPSTLNGTVEVKNPITVCCP